MVMAHYPGPLPYLALFFIIHSCLAITCPGFPGYCSESFPGQTCNVVCARGRNNVPLCQEDGTWTDLPRCVEHDPGTEEQIAGLCPGISGYCSQSFYDGRCNFKCHSGPDINSVCTHDGTWEPYPTCQDDLRETQDGCSSCPGPLGDKRNRTAEAILARKASNLNNRINHNRVPKAGSIDSDPISNNGQRKSVPSFAGFQKFGQIKPTGSSRQSNANSLSRFPQQQRRPTQQSQTQFSRNQIQVQGRNNGQTLFSQIENRIKTQQTTPRPSVRRIPTSSIRSTAAPTRRRLPPPPTQRRPPPPPTQRRPPPPPTQRRPPPPPTQRRPPPPPTQRRPPPPPTQSRLPETRPPPPPQRPSQGASQFGVFESVDLSNSLPTVATSRRNQNSFSDVRSSGPSPPSDGFFGVFQEVDLSG